MSLDTNGTGRQRNYISPSHSEQTWQEMTWDLTPFCPKESSYNASGAGPAGACSPLQQPSLHFPLPLCRWLETVLYGLIHDWWVEANTEAREGKAHWNWSPSRKERKKKKKKHFFAHVLESSNTQLLSIRCLTMCVTQPALKGVGGRRGRHVLLWFPSWL